VATSSSGLPNPPTSPPNASMPPAAPPPKAGLSGGAKALIAIVVVIVLVVAVLALGLIPGISLFGTSAAGNGVGSASALGDASGPATSHDAGSVVTEIGISTTFSFSFGYTSGNSSCSVTGGLSSDADNFTVPAETGSYASGSAVMWIFLYYNSVGPSESVVAVVGSTAHFLGQVSGALCVGALDLLPIPAGTVDSVAAASAIDASAFTSAHGSATALYELVDSENSTAGPEWAIAFTNCSYDPNTNMTTGGDAGDVFYGIVNGTSGAAVVSAYEDDLNCSGLGLTNLSLDSGAPLAWVVGSLGAPAASLLGFASTVQNADVSVASGPDRAAPAAR
jgi:hypothetical protein